MKTVEKLRIAPIGTIVNFADPTLIIKRFRAIVKGKMVICRGCVFRSKGGANSCKYMTACFAKYRPDSESVVFEEVDTKLK